MMIILYSKRAGMYKLVGASKQQRPTQDPQWMRNELLRRLEARRAASI